MEEIGMDSSIEIERKNVTVSDFLSYIKRQCAKKNMEMYFDKDEFINPMSPGSWSYYIKDGIKYGQNGGHSYNYEVDEAPCKSESSRSFPYDYQICIVNNEGSMFNEICEFTFDDDKRGHGYYYQINKD